MRKGNIYIVTTNHLCTGCGACCHICPASAISMVFSPVGRLIPVIKNEICTHCGLCLDVCPGINPFDTASTNLDTTLMGNVCSSYWAKSNSELVYKNAQSGGCVTETLNYLFDNNLIDACLVVGQEKQNPVAKVITNKQDLSNTQSSQYVPVGLVCGLSSLGGYKHTAVVGLPCHIEAIIKLKKRFPQKYANIDYLLGLICAGTLGQSMIDIIRVLAKRRIGAISENDRISWRQKKYSEYRNAKLAIIKNDGSVATFNNSIRHIAKHHLTSPRCRLCYDKMNLGADIVYGDCWGVMGDDSDEGANVIITRSQLGDSIVSDMITNKTITARRCSVDSISKGQVLTQKTKEIAYVASTFNEVGLTEAPWAYSFKHLDSVCQERSIVNNEVKEYLERDNSDRESVVRDVVRDIRKQLFLRRVSSVLRHIKDLFIIK